MKSDYQIVLEDLEEEVEAARLKCEEAEANLRTANAVFDRIMRLRSSLKARVGKERAAFASNAELLASKQVG